MEIIVNKGADDMYHVCCESVGLFGSVFMVQFDDGLFNEVRVSEFVDMIKTYFMVDDEINVVYGKNDDSATVDDESFVI